MPTNYGNNFSTKLDAIIDGVVNQTGIPQAAAFGNAIAQVLRDDPALLTAYDNYASGTNAQTLTSITLVNGNGGNFDPSTGTITLGINSLLSGGNVVLTSLADIMGHEGQHDADAPTVAPADSLAGTAIANAVHSAAPGTPVNLTDVFNTDITAHINDEGAAAIAGWNASVVEEESRLGVASLTNDQIANLLNGNNEGSFFFSYGSGYVRPGFELSEVDPAQIVPTQANIQLAATEYGLALPSMTPGNPTYRQNYAAPLVAAFDIDSNGTGILALNYNTLGLQFGLTPPGYTPITASDATIDQNLLASGLIHQNLQLINTANGDQNSFQINGTASNVTIQATLADGDSQTDFRSYTSNNGTLTLSGETLTTVSADKQTTTVQSNLQSPGVFGNTTVTTAGSVNTTVTNADGTVTIDTITYATSGPYTGYETSDQSVTYSSALNNPTSQILNESNSTFDNAAGTVTVDTVNCTAGSTVCTFTSTTTPIAGTGIIGQISGIGALSGAQADSDPLPIDILSASITGDIADPFVAQGASIQLASGAVISIVGSHDSIAATGPAAVTLTGQDNSVQGSGVAISLGTGATASVTGPGNSVGLIDGTQVNVAGASNVAASTLRGTEVLDQTNTGSTHTVVSNEDGTVLGYEDSTTSVDSNGVETTDTISTTTTGVITGRTVLEVQPDGSSTNETYDALNNPVSVLLTNTDGTTTLTTFNSSTDANLTTVVNTDASGAVTSTVTTTIATGGYAQTTTDADGNVTGIVPIADSGVTTAVAGLNDVDSALNLLQDIKNGQALPAAAAGLTLAGQIANATGFLNGASEVGTGLENVIGLEQAIQAGNVGAAVGASLQIAGVGAAFVGGNNAVQQALDGDSISQSIDPGGSSLPSNLAYVEVAIDVLDGNYKGAALDALNIYVSTVNPIAGAVLEVAETLFGLLGGDSTPPTPWGAGSFVLSANGALTLSIIGANGGQQVVEDELAGPLAYLNSVIQAANAHSPSYPISVIQSRMPTLSYDGTDFTLSEVDPLSGSTVTYKFDSSGNSIGAPVGSADYFATLQQQLVASALEDQALAPLWEVQTANEQHAAGNPIAGLTDVQIAEQHNDLAKAPAPGATTQSFNPIVMDLEGVGIDTIPAASSGVLFDVDGHGFDEATDWISPNDAFLVLDTQDTGQINIGNDLFSDAAVAPNMRGLKALGEYSITGDGIITSADPVFNALEVWRDVNGNGVVDPGELSSLSSLGITELDYANGTFIKNGQTLQMETADLTASTTGVATVVTPYGIQLTTTDGQVSVVIDNADQIQNISQGLHAITTGENEPISLEASTLASTDQATGPGVTSLTVTAVEDATGGTVSLTNGSITFTPTTNYNGTGSFHYTEVDNLGHSSTGTVEVNVTAIAQPITISGPGNNIVPIYGTEPIDPDGSGDDGYINITDPGPGENGDAGNAPNPSTGNGADPYNGVITVTDPNNTYVSYSVVQGQEGYATVSQTGAWSYSPDVDHDTYTGPFDAFQIDVVDGDGEHASITITVPVLDPPDTVSGGGDPIVLAMNGSPIVTTPLSSSNVFFDMSGNGYRNQTSWVGSGDAFLFFDPTGQGSLTSGKQFDLTNYVLGATDNLQALGILAGSGQSALTSASATWNDFYIWNDANGNGVVDPGEVESLAQAGITSLGVTSTNQFSLNDGNVVTGSVTANTNAGDTIAGAEVTLNYNNQVEVTNSDGTTSVVTQGSLSSTSAITGDGLLLGNIGNSNIQTGSGNDTVFSGDGNDLIQAGSGNDVIYSGAGQDIITAGSGNDAIYTGSGSTMVEAGDGADAVISGSGNDMIFLGNGNDIAYGGTGNDLVRVGDGIDTVVGGSGSIEIIAGNGNDLLEGGAGPSQINVGSGNDTLVAGAGGATLNGGAGNDTFIINSDSDVVAAINVSGQNGLNFNTVETSIDYVAGNAIQAVVGLGSANLVLSGGTQSDETIQGNDGNDALYSGYGNETLISGTGVDTLYGGPGTHTVNGGVDSFYVNNSADVVQASSTSTGDTIFASVDYTNSAFIDNLVGVGSASIKLTGASDQTQTITANDANDTLVAGSFLDTLIGGAGNDTFIVDSADTQVNAEASGYNTVDTSVNLTAASNIESLIGTGSSDMELQGGLNTEVIQGNSANDLILAGYGPETLISGSGVDTLVGATTGFGGADTTYVINNASDVVEDSNDVQNTIVTSVNFTAGDDGISSIIGTGNSDLYLSDGGVGAMSIIGNAGNDTLVANNAEDTLTAGSGIDTLIATDDNETFIVNNSFDSVEAVSGSDPNTIETSVSYASTSNIQFLTGTGANNLWLTANDSDETVTGNSGNDTLMAGSGNDTLISGSAATTMYGGSGNDTFAVNNSADEVFAQAGSSNTIQASVSFAAGQNVQSLIGDGSAEIYLTAGAATTYLQGNAGYGVLDTRSANGAVTMVGGAAGDTFLVSNVGDVVDAAGPASQNQIESSVNYTAAADVGQIYAGAPTNVALTANALDDTLGAGVFAGTSDTLIGASGNDTFIGEGPGAVTMIGGSGTDLFEVNSTADTVIAQSAGSNTVWTTVNFVGGANISTIDDFYATTGISITAGSGSVVLQGGQHGDTLVSGAGLDSLFGGSSGTEFVVNNASDVVNTEGFSDDSILSSVNFSANGIQTLTGIGNTSITLTGDSGNDQITANSGNDTLVSGSGIDTLVGGTGNDTFVLNNIEDQVSAQVGGANTIETYVSDYSASPNIQRVIGEGDASIFLDSGAQTTYMQGNDGFDDLDAANATGPVTMVGGANGATFIIASTGDTIEASGSASQNVVESDVSYTAAADVGQLVTEGSNAIELQANNGDSVLVGGFPSGGADTLVAGSGNDTLIADQWTANTLVGGTGTDLFEVNNIDDVVQAQAGSSSTIWTTVSYTASANVTAIDDVYAPSAIQLTGNGGNDLINGASNADTLVSGSGIDTLTDDAAGAVFIVNNSADQVEGYMASVQTLESSVNFTAAAGFLSMTGIGTSSISLTANGLNDTLIGNSGFDTLVAGAGIDTLIGGANGATFVVDNLSDVINDTGTANAEITTISLTAASGVSSLTAQGSGALTLTGNSEGDHITANVGNDTLIAGSGLATLTGGTGSDVFVVNNTGDTVIAISGSNINTIQTSVSFTAAANVVNLNGVGGGSYTLTGNSLAGTITANNGNDTLIAGSGFDTLVGGTGNDTFVVNNTADSVIAGSGSHQNTIQSSVSFTATGNVTNLTGTGSGNISLTGDSLAGTISANSGNDTLTAGYGVDTLVGGIGNDTFVVNSTADSISAMAGSNVNTVDTSVSLTAGSNIRNLTATGSANVSLAGNGLAGTITANSGTDTLTAGAGVDTLVGGSGSDTFVVNNTADSVLAMSGANINTIDATVSFAASANVTQLTATGSGSVMLTANSLNDTLTASTTGIDTLVGGAGADTFVVNNLSDVVQAVSSSNVNTIDSSVNYTASAYVANLTGVGTGAITLTGNSLNDVIKSNSGHDTLVAGSGVDTLTGGSAGNAFVVNNAGDTLQILGTSNSVSTSVSWTAESAVQTLTGTGTGNLTLTGNNVSNLVITSNTGVDTLVGGTGGDTFYVNNTADVLTTTGSNNTVSTSVNFSAGTGVATLETSTSGVKLTSTSAGTVLKAMGNAETLVGGGGTYYVYNTSDIVQSTGSATVEAFANYTATSGVSNVYATGAGVTVGTGNMNDSILVTGSADTVTAGSGTHTITNSGTSAATVNTGTGTDTVSLGTGGGTLTMGTGTDTATLGSGAATVQFSSGTDKVTLGTGSSTLTFGTGTNTIADNSTAGSSAYSSTTTISTDTAESTQTGSLMFGGATSNQLWFERSGNNLEILTIGTSHVDVITNWFSSASDDIASIKAADGKTLVESQVANLVSAMSAFSPPAAGSTAFTSQEQSALATQLAASWH